MENKKFIKILSSVLSVFLATNNFAFAVNKNSNVMQNVQEKIKKNKGKLGVLALGTGLIAISVLMLASGDGENNDKQIDKRKDEKEVITKIPANEWFEKLGGNNEYIREYICKYGKKTISDIEKGVIQKNANQIKKDTPRTESRFSKNQKDTCLKILEKILLINSSEGTEYVQGFDSIAAMVINKFLRYSDHDCTIEDEAKIYYVYKTILKTVSDKNENGETDVCKCQSRAIELLKKYDLSTNLNRCCYYCYISFITSTTLTSFSRFPLKFSISIWDNIIKNSQNTEFDSKYAFNKISSIAEDIIKKIAKKNIEDDSLFKLLNGSNISEKLINFLPNEYPLS